MIRKIISVFLLVSPILSYSQGFQVNLQGQKQQAMGGTGTALMQDAAAVFFNPGGVSFLKQNSVCAGATATIANATFLDRNTSLSFHTVSPVSTPFAAYGVWGADSTKALLCKFKFGFGAYTPFGSIVTWEKGWTGRYNLTSLKLLSIFYQPTVSFKITDKIGIGAGAVYGTGNVELKQDIPVSSSSSFAGNADLKGKASAWGYNAGIYFKPIDKLSIGLTYRSGMKMNLKNGDATFTVPSALKDTIPSGKFTAKLPLPSVLTLGLASSINDKLTLALDINYVGWHTYDTLGFDYEKNTGTLKDTKLPRLYKNTFAYRLGAQYKIDEHFTARAGVNVEITPIPDGYVTPEVPDANRVNYSLGIGYKIKHFMIDASYTFEGFTRKSFNNDPNVGPSGTYRTFINAPGISVSYNF